MAAVTLTQENFNEEIKSAQTVLVDFWAPWCGPCRMMGPVVEELANDLTGQVKVCKVNIDEEPDLATKFGIASIPTLVIFRDGEAAETLVGTRPKPQILQALGISR